MRFPLVSLLLLTSMLALPGGAALAPPVPEPPARDAVPASGDSGYLAVLQAYRGELTEEQIEALGERDPAPALYLSPQNPGERAVTRFFGSLPEGAHEQLRKSGYLKWRVDRLPKEQRAWIKQAAEALQARRQGPFPLSGKEPASTGFAQIKVAGQERPQYCWWIAAADGKLSWVTVVRALGLLTQVYSDAYREQLPPLIDQPETEPIPSNGWMKIRETPRKPPPAPVPAAVLADEKHYWSIVRAYRGQLAKDELRSLTDGDRVLGDRLKSSNAAGRAVNELFAKLTDAQHRALLTTGRLVWTEADLTKPQRKLIDVVLRDLNERTGGGMDLYLLAPAFATRTGFALVHVPEVATPVISWWVSSPSVPHPAWIPLANDPAVKAAGYYRAHLEQLPGS